VTAALDRAYGHARALTRSGSAWLSAASRLSRHRSYPHVTHPDQPGVARGGDLGGNRAGRWSGLQRHLARL